MARITSLVLPLLVITALFPCVLGQERIDWPMWRGDRHNSGHFPLPGNMDRTPDILWKQFTGGYADQAMGKDVNGDGEEEVVLLSAGMIRAVSRSGGELWSTPSLGLSGLLGVEDLGGDGRMDLIACRSSTTTIFVLDLETGDITWNHTFPSPSSGIGRPGFKIANISGRFEGPEIVVWPSKSSIGYAFGFVNGGGELLWHANAPQTRNFPPPIAVADLDLDGTKELVLATFERIYSFDGETGEPEMSIHSPGINRNYGIIYVLDLDEDPYPEIPVLCSNLNEHLWMVDNDGDNLSEMWDVFFEYSYPEDHKELRITVDSVCDVDRDEDMEIVFSVFDSSGDGRWHTKIWDALTGEEEMDIPDQYLVHIADLDGDGMEEVATSEQYGRSTTYYSNVTIWRNGAPAAILRNCGLVEDRWAPFPEGVNSIANIERWMETDEGYLIRANGSLGVLNLKEGGAEIKWILDESSVQASLSMKGVFEGSGVIASGNDGLLRVYDGGGNLVTSCRTGGFLPYPTAADVDGDGLPEVLVRRSDGQHMILESNGSEKCRFSAFSRYAKFSKDGSLISWDIDGDGDMEIIAAGDGSLRLLDSRGMEKRRYEMPSRPYDWTVGNVTGDGYWDLFVSCLGSGPHTARTMALDGETGEIVWEKDWGPYAGFIGIMDYDEDGLDDLVVREHFDFYVIIGPTGREKKGKDLCGYHVPIITDVEGDGTTEVIWGGGWGSLSMDRKRKIENEYGKFLYMTQIWVNLFGGGDSREVYGLIPGVADIDGDGIREIGAGNSNGTLHIFGGEKGELEEDYWLGSTPSDVVSCDVDSDGLPEFIFGTRDGRLISLGAEGMEWEHDFGYGVGDPVLCDLDLDEMADILVPVMDGNLYALHIGEMNICSLLAFALIACILCKWERT